MTKPNPSLSEAPELQRQSYYSQDNPTINIIYVIPLNSSCIDSVVSAKTGAVFAKNKVAITENKVEVFLSAEALHTRSMNNSTST